MYQWITGIPEEVGISSASVCSCLDELQEKGIPMHSFLLWKDGKLVTEGYYSPCEKDELHRLFSVTKSFVSVAVGVLCDRGIIRLDDPIVSWFPEYLPPTVHPWLAETTIRDMLMMRSCYSSTTYKKDLTANWVESFFTSEPDHKPGTVFHYDTSASHTLCALVEKLTGMKLLDFLREVCLDELGFSRDAYVLEDPFGTSMGGSGLMASSRDFLLFALLVMHRGQLNGKQYLPSWYLHEATTNQVATCVKGPIPAECCGYGYQFWRGEHDSIVCYGMGGQLAIMLPQFDFICVTTADTQGYGGGNQVIYDTLFRHLLPQLTRQTAAEPVTAQKSVTAQKPVTAAMPVSASESFADCASLSAPSASLASRLCSLAIQPLDASLDDAQRIASRYAGQQNRSFSIVSPGTDFEALTFSFSSADSGCLTYVLHGQQCSLPFGIGTMKVGTFPLYQMKCAVSGTWLSDDCLYLKVHLLDTSVGSIHIQTYFGEDDVTVFMRKQEETLFHEYSGHLYGKRIK
ncbi:MAG: serine hydrolase [Lachnospiraceae bacterium]|nr:serine hydrolase [Lachnospiraceae bacterium]